jgi:hypothetical protein
MEIRNKLEIAYTFLLMMMTTDVHCPQRETVLPASLVACNEPADCIKIYNFHLTFFKFFIGFFLDPGAQNPGARSP